MLQSPTSEVPTYVDIYEYTHRRIVQHPRDTAVRGYQAGAADGRLDSFSPCIEQDLMQTETALRATSGPTTSSASQQECNSSSQYQSLSICRIDAADAVFLYLPLPGRFASAPRPASRQMLHGYSLRSQSEEPASLSIGLRTYNTLYQLMHVAIANVRRANLHRYI